MNGLATRNKLRASLHPDVHGDVVDVPQSADAERRGATLLGYKRYRDDEDIPEPTFVPGGHALGTPMEERRLKAARLERLYDRAFRVAGAIIVILVALGGYGHYAREQTAQQQLSAAAYRLRAERLAAGEIACETDPHENCLVCLHRDATGATVVSHHC